MQPPLPAPNSRFSATTPAETTPARPLRFSQTEVTADAPPSNAPRTRPPVDETPRAVPATSNLIWIRRLIWTYFWLLIFEGALRKWVVPSLSNVLLIIRDPVVLGIYILAIRARQFPFNGWTFATLALAILSVAASVLFTTTSLFVSVYGLRADFWHLPLIWVMGQTLRRSDVLAMGKAILIVLLGMALLMAAQFQAPPTSFINAGRDAQFEQISTSLGRIRPPGTWSFVLGPIYFWGLATAFLVSSQLPTRIGGQLKRTPYSPILLIAATAALFLGATVSGSRALLAGCAVVMAAGFLIALLRQPLILVRWVGLGALLTLALFAAQEIPVVKQGFDTLFARINDASAVENQTGGFLARYFRTQTEMLPLLWSAPWFGYGLGAGTNVGAVAATGAQGFLLAEAEWGRVILESGPILGGCFILLRLILALYLLVRSFGRALTGDALPFLLWAASFSMLIEGQWGVATAQGMATLGAGLCLASLNTGKDAVGTR